MSKEKMRDKVEGLLAALNRGELDIAYEIISDDCALTTGEYSLVGRKAIEAVDFPYLRLLESHWRRIEHVIVAGNTVVTWLKFGGTANGTGKSFEMEVCNVFGFADDKVIEWQMYGDFSLARAVLS
jgi:ketosteroid isomerase-like protein